MSQPYTDSAASQKLGWVVWLCSDKRTPWKLSVHNDVFRGKQKRLSLVVYNALYKIHPLCRHTVQLQRRIYVNERNVMFARLAVYRFSILKSSWQRAGNAAYMPHSQQRHAYKNNTHKTRRNLTTKCNDNKKEKKNNDQYLVCIPRLTLPKEFLNDNNNSKLTMLGGRLFQTLIIRSLKMFSHINMTLVDAQFIWVPASCSIAATPRLQRKIIRHVKIY